jgi:hypothetical protein
LADFIRRSVRVLKLHRRFLLTLKEELRLGRQKPSFGKKPTTGCCMTFEGLGEIFEVTLPIRMVENFC